MIWLILILVALAWASWMFSDFFAQSNKGIKFSLAIVLVLFASAALYWQYGAYQKIDNLMVKHQQLQALSVTQLADKVSDKSISLEDLFAELRLRSEAKPLQTDLWIELATIFLNTEQISHAEQAFGRAVNTKAVIAEQHKLRLQFARAYLDKGTEQALTNSQRHLSLILLDNPEHEGALLIQGITSLRMKNYQSAIDHWQKLLSQRESGSDSAKLISQQIEVAKSELLKAQTNFIKIQVNNFNNIPLQRFTKAFALVRSEAGGPPVAVKSLSIEELASPILLGPQNIMLAGTDMWQVTDIKVEIRLSQSGMANSSSGDYYGQTETLSAIKPGDSFMISVNKIVK